MPPRGGRLILALALALAGGRTAAQDGAQPRLSAHALLEFGTSLDDGGTALGRTELEMGLQWPWEHCEFKLAWRGRDEPSLASSARHESDWREAALGCRQGAWQWTLGRQSLAWGKADALAVLDQWHPFDRREFPLADRERSRLALAMLRVDTQVGETDQLQWLLAPERREDRLPEPGAAFAEGWSIWPAALAASPPPSRWARPQWGMAWEHLGDDWAWSLNLADQWAPLPQVGFDAQGLAQRQPYRRRLLGASVDTELDGWVLRAEAAVIAPVALPSPTQASGWARYRQSSLIVGVDRMLGENLLAAQWMRSQLDNGPAGDASRRQDWFTLALNRRVMQDRWQLKAWGAWDLTRRARWLSAQARLQWNATWSATLTIDALQGRLDSPLGVFRDRDRVVLACRADW